MSKPLDADGASDDVTDQTDVPVDDDKSPDTESPGAMDDGLSDDVQGNPEPDDSEAAASQTVDTETASQPDPPDGPSHDGPSHDGPSHDGPSPNDDAATDTEGESDTPGEGPAVDGTGDDTIGTLVTSEHDEEDSGDQLSLADTNEYAAGVFGEMVTQTAAEAPVAQPATVAPAPVLSIWPVWSWSMVAVVTVVLVIAVAFGVLSRTLILDIISFWPVFVVILLVMAAMFPRTRRGAPRLSAVLPLLLLTTLGVSAVLHVSRWERLPSTAADVLGPSSDGVTDASIQLALPGDLVVAAAEQPELYKVLMSNRGGSTAAPTAFEIIRMPGAAINVTERSDAGWFTSQGWEVPLSLAVTWDVEAVASHVDINLASVSTGGVSVVGDGIVVLGFVRPGATIALDGALELVISGDDRVDVVGEADVPESWTASEGGYSSPGNGESYVVTVAEGAMVTIRTR